MSDDTSTPLEEDVVVTDDNIEEQEIIDEVNQVDETTDDSDYDKAWETIDTNNPSEGLFGETTEDETLEEQDTVTESVEEPQVTTEGLMIKNPVLKYKGRDVPIDSEEEAINLMQKGFKLESEMSKIKPMKGMISILQDGNISVEDLTTFKDALSGNEGAKTALANKLGLRSQEESNDFFSEDVTEKKAEEVYKPDVKTEDPVSSYFAELTETQPEVAGKVSQVYSDIEDEFKLEVYTPQVFPMFATSIASGEFDRLYPIAIKMRLGNPGLTWLQAYQLAGEKQGKVEEKTVVPPKSTGIPRGTSPKRTSGDSYERAWDMDTKDLEAKLFG